METNRNRFSAFLLIGAAAAATCVLAQAMLGRGDSAPAYYQLDVGQGDAEVVLLPGGALVMTDAGPDSHTTQVFEKALPAARRIDLAVISHPQLDHFGGFAALLDRYEVGAFIVNGRDNDAAGTAWTDLLRKIRAKHIPIVTLGAGDSVRYGASAIRFLSPNQEFLHSGELNDTGLVEYVSTSDWTALLTADTGEDVERALLTAALAPVDILKVGHHGSKYSTSDRFLERLHPRVALISVGAKNTYGHPAPSTLARFAAFHIPVFRTEKQGTIVLRREKKTLHAVFER